MVNLKQIASLLNEQKFDTFDKWVTFASSRLTAHPNYHPDNFKAICFDTDGRKCSLGSDFMRARDEDKFPVYWLWPDQVVEMIISLVLTD